MIMATNPAPDEIPIIPGSARGFLITPCSIAPESERLIPTNTPTIVLGILTFHITSPFGVKLVGFFKISIISLTDISILPYILLTKKDNTANRKNNNIIFTLYKFIGLFFTLCKLLII